jgi:Xaa-Pro aminopeptidase
LPRIHKTNHELLEENNVITIEPGIYIPNWGGVRIEDDCLITLDGCIPLNKSTKELIII